MVVKPCPKCGCPDELILDSSSAAEASWIECAWCGHRMQAKCDEETLEARWNRLSRKHMPLFDLDAELEKLEAQHAAARAERAKAEKAGGDRAG